ncbi:hypothetical protein PC128_g22725 [Phytophthora cactorum]|nr:hypothetical protein PC128_g22725 [Phytophthora cactorum]
MDVSDESERFFAGEGEHLLVKEGGKTRFFGEEERFRDEDAPLFFTLLGDDGRSVIIFLEDDEGSTFSFSDNDDRFDFDSSGAASRLHCLHHYWTTRGLSFRGLGPFSFRLGHRKLLFLVLRLDSGASRIGEHEIGRMRIPPERVLTGSTMWLMTASATSLITSTPVHRHFASELDVEVLLCGPYLTPRRWGPVVVFFLRIGEECTNLLDYLVPLGLGSEVEEGAARTNRARPIPELELELLFASPVI